MLGWSRRDWISISFRNSAITVSLSPSIDTDFIANSSPDWRFRTE